MPAKTYFIMTRAGQFLPRANTPNQCKAPGHVAYDYTLRMVFQGDAQLNKQHFIIDHAAIDTMIQRLQLTGSCEDMSTQILAALDKFMRDHGIFMLGCRCLIRPLLKGGADPEAFLERVHISDGAPADTVRLLQS